MPISLELSPNQRDACNKAFDILSEHFPAFVTIVELESAESDDGTAGHYVQFYGGWSRARGLCLIAGEHVANRNSVDDINDNDAT